MKVVASCLANKFLWSGFARSNPQDHERFCLLQDRWIYIWVWSNQNIYVRLDVELSDRARDRNLTCMNVTPRTTRKNQGHEWQ